MRKALIAEFTASMFLLVAVVGSGIAADRLSDGNVGLALLANALATGGALFALILVFQPLSGAHMNPIVTLVAAILGDLPWSRAAPYIAAQVAGALTGVLLAHAMFELPLMQFSGTARTGPNQWLAEVVATAGLLIVIHGSVRHGINVLAAAVAAYITGAYWFTASTSFANPAVTFARALTDTFAGIRPEDAPGFILAQIVAVAISLPIVRMLRQRDVVS